jgi:small-conductance mechanosensitive channel
MNEQFSEIRAVVLSMLTDTAAAVISFLPKLIAAVAVLLVGWLLARLVSAVLERSVRGGLDALLERSGVTQALEATSLTATPSEILGRVSYWLIVILFLMAASEIVGLSAVTGAITRILSYIPSVISAALVLAAGVFLARFVGNVVSSGASAANLSYAKGLGAVANTSIIVMVGVVTLEQLGVDAQILITVITVTVAAITAGMGLAFALGARDVVRAILAGHYLRQTLSQGTQVQVGGERGTVEEIGSISTTFRGESRTWSVPNTRLMDDVIEL